MTNKAKTDTPPKPPDDFVDRMEDWLIEYGPDGHCDGATQIAFEAWWWMLNDQRDLLDAAMHLFALAVKPYPEDERQIILDFAQKAIAKASGWPKWPNTED